MSKRALITGITGQDGYYLAKHLLNLGYEVHGAVRHTSHDHADRLWDLAGRIDLHRVDLIDQGSIIRAIEKSQPDEIYNLAAMSFVPVSFEEPILTAEITGLGVVRMLEAVRLVNPKIKFFQASSSEMFGGITRAEDAGGLNESSPFYPRSPYAAAKVYAHHMVRHYREAYGLFAAAAIMFNHESPRRGECFVTRKIARAAAAIALGTQEVIRLGNLQASRDWGYAPEYMEAAHLLLQLDQPADAVIATGQTATVQDFASAAFVAAGIFLTDHLVPDPTLCRPTDVDVLIGDPARMYQMTGWRAKTNWRELAKIMVRHEISLLERGEK